MYVVTNRIPINKEFRDEFEQRFRNRAGQIDKQPGFVRMEILRPLDDDGSYCVSVMWENEDAFKNWVKSEDFAIAHQNPLPKSAYAGEARMERHERIIFAGVSK